MEADARTKWGRTKFAGGRFPAMAIAIPIGVALGALCAIVAAWTGVAGGEHTWLISIAIGFCLCWPLVALAFALVVDRDSLRGATERPEESVETRWLDQASEGAFRDTILITGLALTAIALAGLHFDALWALMGVLVVALLSCGIRYLVAKRQG